MTRKIQVNFQTILLQEQGRTTQLLNLAQDPVLLLGVPHRIQRAQFGIESIDLTPLVRTCAHPLSLIAAALVVATLIEAMHVVAVLVVARCVMAVLVVAVQVEATRVVALPVEATLVVAATVDATGIVAVRIVAVLVVALQVEAKRVVAPPVKATPAEAATVEAFGIEAVDVVAVLVVATQVEATGVEAVPVEATLVVATTVEATGIVAIDVVAAPVETTVVSVANHIPRDAGHAMLLEVGQLIQHPLQVSAQRGVGVSRPIAGLAAALKPLGHLLVPTTTKDRDGLLDVDGLAVAPREKPQQRIQLRDRGLGHCSRMPAHRARVAHLHGLP
mmetsp:Transcript_9586/g.19750  ORF Transcript_9586/g.19750 Transcript_9586/m.19750 type:complete len:332 (+) Transcript_9586:92-1087(+)